MAMPATGTTTAAAKARHTRQKNRLARECDPQRRGLAQRLNDVVEFEACVGFGGINRSTGYQTVLLKDVRDKLTGAQLADHVWSHLVPAANEVGAKGYVSGVGRVEYYQHRSQNDRSPSVGLTVYGYDPQERDYRAEHIAAVVDRMRVRLYAQILKTEKPARNKSTMDRLLEFASSKAQARKAVLEWKRAGKPTLTVDVINHLLPKKVATV